MNKKQGLRVFLCHASSDKSRVKILHDQLIDDGIDAWLDTEKLLPGQDWNYEIQKAVKNSHIVIACLSSQSITKEGFVQKEIKIALDIADEKPEGTIFIIPARLETCEVPDRIKKFQWVDLFSSDGYNNLFKALKIRASSLGVSLKNKPSRESIQSTDSTALFEEGRKYLHAKEHDKAIETFSSAINVNPNFIGNWNLRGKAYMEKWGGNPTRINNLMKAISDFSTSLRLDSSAVAIYRLRGEGYAWIGESDKAIEDLRRVITTVKDPAAYFYLGWAFHQKDELRNAIYHYNEAIKIDPLYDFAYLYLSWAYLDIGDEENAAVNYKRAIKIRPNLLGFERSRNKNAEWNAFKARYT